MKQSPNLIVELTHLDKKGVLRALPKGTNGPSQRIYLTSSPARSTFLRPISDEIGRINERLSGIRDTKRDRGASMQPLFGVLCRNGQVWTEIVENVDESTLLPLIAKKAEQGFTICSDTLKAYTGIAAKGYVHRLENHREWIYSDVK